MRRVTLRRRLDDERGAAAVLVALLLVPLLGCAALAVDIAAAHSARQALQNGADAAALAIARDCASAADCGDEQATADQFADQNAGHVGTLGASKVTIDGNTVTVTTTATRAHGFASILGISESTLQTEATATWTSGGSGGGGTQTMDVPVAMSWCEYEKQLAQPDIVRHFVHQTTPSSTCTGPEGNQVAGGWAVFQPPPGTCRTPAAAGDRITRVTQAAAPQVATACATGTYKSNLVASHVKEIQIAIWDQSGSSGGNTWYRIRGFVTFNVHNYELAHYYWNGQPNNPNSPMLTGRFTSELDQGSGAATVSLTTTGKK